MLVNANIQSRNSRALQQMQELGINKSAIGKTHRVTKDGNIEILFPLTEYEKGILRLNGWEFVTDDYIYIPSDYDGCMAYGLANIRRILDKIKEKLDIE